MTRMLARRAKLISLRFTDVVAWFEFNLTGLKGSAGNQDADCFGVIQNLRF